MQIMSKELRNILWLGLLLGGLILAILAGWHQARTTSTAAASAEVEQGRQVYADQCASCHGADLEGQPDWQIPGADGTLPAPPHDDSGHTWHHDDAMLADYIRRGGQSVLDDMGVPMTSGMPAFGEILTEDDIAAILSFIKSNWPEDIRAIQARRNSG